MAPQCTARSKQTGERCKQRPVKGGTVCRFHGGKAPQVAAAAAQRELESKASELLSRMIWNPSAAPVTDSVGEMRQLAGSMRHAADVLGSRLNDGVEVCEHCHRGPEPLDGVTGTAWLRVLRELRQLLADMERLGIAGRAQELSESQAAVMFAIHQAVLELLHRELPGGLSVALRDKVVETVLAGIGRGPETVLELEGGAA